MTTRAAANRVIGRSSGISAATFGLLVTEKQLTLVREKFWAGLRCIRR